jgi:hypothetical protein
VNSIDPKYKIERRGDPSFDSPDTSEEITVYAGCMRHVVLRQKDRLGQEQYISIHPEDIERLIDYLINATEDGRKIVLRG